MSFGISFNNANGFNNNNNFDNICDAFGLNEGDRIRVLTTSGATAVGVFLRCVYGFLIWIRNSTNGPVITITSLDGISISKI